VFMEQDYQGIIIKNKHCKKISRKLSNAHIHNLPVVLISPNISCADQLDIEHILDRYYQHWCIFLIDQNQIHHLEVQPCLSLH